MRIAVVGAGLTGLTASIRLAEKGHDVELFEAAPQPGGRTGSFVDPVVNRVVDHGPHLLIGAYHTTIKLLKSLNIEHHVSWQERLILPLWEQQRGHFSLAPSSLPLPLSLPLACLQMPGHHRSSLFAMLRIAMASRLSIAEGESVGSWLGRLNIPDALFKDMLEPICFGAMNEGVEQANALTFARVLRESFANHQAARLGWFNRPLSEALIEPMVKKAESLGVNIRCRNRIRRLAYGEHAIRIHGEDFSKLVMAMPPRAFQQLTGQKTEVETGSICNVHMWFQQGIEMEHPFIGMIGGWCHWFFHVTKQMQGREADDTHICAVISAESPKVAAERAIEIAWRELKVVLNQPELTKPMHARVVRVRDATNVVRLRQKIVTHPRMFNACESPSPGDLPATIEFAVARGERVTAEILSDLL